MEAVGSFGSLRCGRKFAFSNGLLLVGMPWRRGKGQKEASLNSVKMTKTGRPPKF